MLAYDGRVDERRRGGRKDAEGCGEKEKRCCWVKAHHAVQSRGLDCWLMGWIRFCYVESSALHQSPERKAGEDTADGMRTHICKILVSVLDTLITS